jgi:hypothetical protein
MEEGILPVAHGLHWVPAKDGSEGKMAEDVPGTHSVMRANRLQAWRCKKCELILLRYGFHHQRALARRDSEEHEVEQEE